MMSNFWATVLLSLFTTFFIVKNSKLWYLATKEKDVLRLFITAYLSLKCLPSLWILVFLMCIFIFFPYDAIWSFILNYIFLELMFTFISYSWATYEYHVTLRAYLKCWKKKNLIESKYQIINIKQNHRKLHKMYFYIKLVLLRFPKRFSKSTCQKNSENEVLSGAK